MIIDAALSAIYSLVEMEHLCVRLQLFMNFSFGKDTGLCSLAHDILCVIVRKGYRENLVS